MEKEREKESYYFSAIYKKDDEFQKRLATLKFKDDNIYIPLNVFFISKQEVPDIPIFIKHKNQYAKIGSKEFGTLAKMGLSEIYFSKDNIPHLKSHLENVLIPAIINDFYLSPNRKAKIIGEYALYTFNEIYKSPTRDTFKKGKTLIKNLITLFYREPTSFFEILSKPQILPDIEDHYICNHSIGVAMNSIALAIKTGAKNSNVILDIGLAGLLHDIGKSLIPDKILQKPDKLNNLEWNEIKRHPLYSYNIVQEISSLSPKAKIAILQHHEDFKGKGYPSGLYGYELEDYTKILITADIFNSMTLPKPYADAQKHFEAFWNMKNLIGHKVDKKHYEFLVRIYGGKFDS